MKYDDEIKKALNLRAENVSVDGNMLYSVKRKIKNQRSDLTFPENRL